MPQAGLYEVPESLIGINPSNLQTIPSQYGFGGRAEDLSAILGSQPLQKGQQFALADVGGQPGEWITKHFTRTSPYAAAESALAASKPITEQAYAERGRQLEGEKQPLTERYSALIDELKRRETKETGAQSTALAREYGKRGVPLSSGAYEQDLAGKTGDISQFYAGQQKDVGFEKEDKLRELGNLLADLPIERARELNLIDQKIGELKATGANQQLQMALEQYKFQREEHWRQQEFDLKKQEFELSKEGSTSLKDQYATIGEGSTLYDLLNRTALYTAPKTYKGSGGDGSALQDLESIFG